ncbi:MAG: hypothetical protein HYU51_18665 [Candidatus Rokubacteria bacterium]|nr:hypothetical protein [Candidatus Rokubacteria bacterium]
MSHLAGAVLRRPRPSQWQIAERRERDRLLTDYLGRWRARLSALGARRIWRGSAWYWELKPDLKPGEVIAL